MNFLAPSAVIEQALRVAIDSPFVDVRGVFDPPPDFADESSRPICVQVVYAGFGVTGNPDFKQRYNIDQRWLVNLYVISAHVDEQIRPIADVMPDQIFNALCGLEIIDKDPRGLRLAESEDARFDNGVLLIPFAFNLPMIVGSIN